MKIFDTFNEFFRAGIPYDAERNEFRVRPEDIARLEFQRGIKEQEERWMSSSRLSNKFLEE